MENPLEFDEGTFSIEKPLEIRFNMHFRRGSLWKFCFLCSQWKPPLVLKGILSETI